jgi:hypothetical protein
MASAEGRSLPGGLVLRPWRDGADFETMATIANATREVDGRGSVTDATQERLAIEGDGGIAEQSVTIAKLDGVDVGHAVASIGWAG